MSLVIQHDVVQLEVTVDNATIMKVHQTKDDLSGIEPVGGVSGRGERGWRGWDDII